MKYNIKSKEIGIFSDVHIGLGQDSSIWHKCVLEFATWVRDLYISKGINDIIIPGDIFHNRNEISVNTLTIAKEFFTILKDFRIFISTGNHDCYYKDRSDVNSINMLSGWNNIIIVDKEPLLIKGCNKTISLIPWGTDITDIPVSDICFGHFEINSFYMNSFKVCDHGVESCSLLDKAPFVLSGHFHKRELRKYDKGKIYYVGSPYQQNFGDVGDERGVYILNLETEEINFFENNISPKHIKINLSQLQNGTQDAYYLKNNVPNNMVSFIIDENISSDKVPLLSSKIQNLNPKFFRIDYKIKDDLDNLSQSSKEYTAIDILQSIEDFVSSLEVQHKPEIINYLNEIYNKLT
jgi:DNA repair exonuclease SbcCD nuclease subunit